MRKLFIAITAVTICCIGNEYPARANCSGSWSSSGYSGRCTDSYGGSYNVRGSGSGSTRIDGYTGDGVPASGTIRNGQFNGYVGNDYVTCDKYNCY